MEKNNKMKIAEEAARLIEEILGDTTAKAVEIYKNNTTMTGIVIRKGEKQAGLVVYIDSCAEKGMDIDEIAQAAIKYYMSAEEVVGYQEKEEVPYLGWQAAKECLQLSVVRREGNGKMLEHLPVRYMEDLAVFLQICTPNFTIKVTESLMGIWGISEHRLFEIASRNMEKYAVEVDVNKLANKLEGCGSADEPPVRIIALTNKEMSWGAGLIACKGFMDKMCDKYAQGKILVVIPSSVHEVLILPEESAGEMLDEIKLIIEGMNVTHCSVTEVLSNHPYVYGKEIGLVAHR